MNSTFRLIAGTAAFGAVVMSQPAPTVAQDPETATYAHSVTVQIQSDREQGSGVIIAKKGSHCTAATAGHVVQDKEINYQVRTANGEVNDVT